MLPLLQAKFLFARAREALSTAGAVDMIERLKQLETKILEVESVSCSLDWPHERENGVGVGNDAE